MTQCHGETTEWFDLQVKYKNYLPNQKEQTTDEIETIVREKIESYDPMESKKLKELQEMEEDNIFDEDDDYIKQYQQKRIEEMKAHSKGLKYGEMREIRYDEYIREVNEASKNCFVVLLLHQDYIPNSQILNKILTNLAVKFKDVKFLRIQATNCVKNFADADVPTVFVYKDGTIYKKFIPAPYYFGGSEMNLKKVEWILNAIKVVKSDLLEDPFDAYEEPKASQFKMKKLKKKERDDESDSEDEEKPGRWKI